MKHILIFLALFFSLQAYSVVDTRSAGYSKTFIDFESSGSGFPIQVKRTYNSRSLFNGLFGYGWCSNIETSLSVLPDGSIKVVECGGGMEVLYHPKGKLPKVDQYVKIILKELRKKNKRVRMSEKDFKALEKDLYKSQNLRAQFIEKLKLKGKAAQGVRYYAKGRAREQVIVTKTGYKRTLNRTDFEEFDRKGRLKKVSSVEGHIDFTWGDKSIKVQDELGRTLTLALSQKGAKVKQATFEKKLVGQYTYKGVDLIRAVNAENKAHLHAYDSLHNLTRNTYPDKTTEVITYNTKKDWVIGFKDRRGCKETYGYGANKKNPNHYFSTVQKKCGRLVVVKSKYEFWHKTGPKGNKYLHRAKARVNGRVQTDVVYHPVFGSPVSLYKNGVRTKRKYDNFGFLKEKDNNLQNVKYFDYSKSCRKPARVVVQYKNPDKKAKKKIFRTETIQFSFNKNCMLTQARKSQDEWVKVRHNEKGQVISMEDQSRKQVTLRWHKKHNKPEVITRKGVGSLRIVYDKKGNVTSIKGLKKDDPTIIAQVTALFNSFLNTLTPVSEEMVIL